MRGSDAGRRDLDDRDGAVELDADEAKAHPPVAPGTFNVITVTIPAPGDSQVMSRLSSRSSRPRTRQRDRLGLAR